MPLQLWDIIESPNFEVVFQEAIDKCFHRIFLELRRVGFEEQGQKKTISSSSSSRPGAPVVDANSMSGNTTVATEWSGTESSSAPQKSEEVSSKQIDVNNRCSPDTNIGQLKQPPFALLLPQFKNLASNALLPADQNTLSIVAEEISNLDSLNALCMIAYDSMSMV